MSMFQNRDGMREIFTHRTDQALDALEAALIGHEDVAAALEDALLGSIEHKVKAFAEAVIAKRADLVTQYGGDAKEVQSFDDAMNMQVDSGLASALQSAGVATTDPEPVVRAVIK